MFNRLKFVFKKYRFEIYNKPGKWMKSTELKKLQKRIKIIAASKLGKSPTFSFFKDVTYLNNKMIVICSRRATSDDLCCCVMSHLGKYKGSNIIHLGAVYSISENRGLMQLVYIFGLLYIFVKNWFFKRVYLTSLTHTPKIFGVVNECFENVYPNLDPHAKPSEIHITLKKIFHQTYLKEWEYKILPRINKNFVIERFRVQNDGSILYPDTVNTVPKHRNEEYNKRCLSLIDVERGDEVFQAAETLGILTILKNSRLFAKAT